MSVQPCPDCGEKLGGRYKHAAAELCWPCWMKRTGVGPLPAYERRPDPDWVVFRRAIGEALDAVDPDRSLYIDEDTCIGACPICITGTVRVFFHGRAPRADITCSLGCGEMEIAEALARKATR